MTEKLAPTEKYYFPMRDGVYYGNDKSHSLFKDMSRYPYSDIEAKAARLNQQAGLVMPVDEDYVECED